MDMQKELKDVKELHPHIDWKMIKDIICGMAKSAKVVCDMMPPGHIKNIICGIASVLSVICHQLPE